MEQVALFLTALVTAFAMENAVLARGLGLGKDTMFMQSPRQAILYGTTFTWMCFVSSLLVVPVNLLLGGMRYVMFLRAPAFLACVLLVFTGTWLLTRRFRPRLFGLIGPVLPLCAFNTALFAAMYIATTRGFGFFQTIGYSLGIGLGFTAAILVIFYARKRLAISPVPRAFRGLPILLIYLGFLSLAIYGLIGHNLPT